MNTKILSVVLVLFPLTSLVFGQHNTLIPAPQSIQYGKGQLRMKGLGIVFGSKASAEDRFAATELTRILRQATGQEVPVWESATGHAAIVLTRTGNVDALAMPGETPGPDSRESYELQVTPGGVRISGHSSAAVFYAIQTLRQLVAGEGDATWLPEVIIRDWPSLAYRGTLVDVGSEGPMSTEDEIKRQLDFLARWKTNQYYFYSEANIELDGYPLLNPNARFTKNQVRRIIAYGRERHIDIVPMVEMYGHLHDLFRIEKYSALADFPHGGEFNPADPKVKAVVTDWAAQFAALFPSSFVNIGFDETWTIQKAADTGSGSTPVQLFVDQLTTVANLFRTRGKQVMAYADIMVKFPGIVSKLPPNLIAVPWFYEATPDPEYKKWLQPLVAEKIPHIVASGVHSWNEITPDYDTTFLNIDTFLNAGRKSHALGLLNTIWTDDGQVLLRQSWPGMAYGAAAPWQSTPMRRDTFFDDYARTIYPAAIASEAAQAFAALNKAEVSLQKVLGQSSMTAVWNDPFAPQMLKALKLHQDDLRECRLSAEEAEEHLYKILASSSNKSEFTDFLVGAKLLDYAGMKFLYAIEIDEAWANIPKTPTKEKFTDATSFGIYNPGHSRLADLLDAISSLRESYRGEWLAQYTEYRLPTALGRWDAEYEYLASSAITFPRICGHISRRRKRTVDSTASAVNPLPGGRSGKHE